MSQHRDGPNRHAERSSLHWLHVATLVAACAAIVFVASGVAFLHVDAPGTEARCQVCHVAHMPVLPGAAPVLQSTPKVVVWFVPAEAQVSHAAPASLDFPARAPPA
jgi:hypothetical protein